MTIGNPARVTHFNVQMPDAPRHRAPLIVLLHGRGADETDLGAVGRALSKEAIVVAPRAPFPGAPWGYGPGWAWYRFIAHDRPEPESFARSQWGLHQFLEELPSRLPVTPGPLALGGFSQGGTTSLAYALAHPGRVAAVLNFSGFLADHPDVRADEASVKGTRFFWGHGTEDQAIPFALAVEGRAALMQAGAELEARDYPMGHAIDRDELDDAAAWLAAVTASA